MRILVVSDAWYPQINGVVRTLDTLKAGLQALGHEVLFITPAGFRTVPLPTYPEIRLSLAGRRTVGRLIDTYRPSAIHIATEGPLGLLARSHCLRRDYRFTTAYHTRFPEYVHARVRLPLAVGYAALRWFHRSASAVMVATQSIEDDLKARGFKNDIRRWTRGVDTQLFRPRGDGDRAGPRPISLYVGRVAVEKNVEAFLSLDLAGTKVVVGDGPQRRELERRYPPVRFLGMQTGEALARCYASADVFVFPSRTDTFGLVILEALACGVPVAAYPVPGPIDILDGVGVGCLDEDLGAAARRALAIPRETCRAYAERFSWDASVRQFVHNLAVIQ